MANTRTPSSSLSASGPAVPAPRRHHFAHVVLEYLGAGEHAFVRYPMGIRATCSLARTSLQFVRPPVEHGAHQRATAGRPTLRRANIRPDRRRHRRRPRISARTRRSTTGSQPVGSDCRSSSLFGTYIFEQPQVLSPTSISSPSRANWTSVRVLYLVQQPGDLVDALSV